MEYRTLGRTGLKISDIGFGAWGIGGGWGKKDDAAALAALNRAFELGINFYDTAFGYGGGHSEELIGQAFKTRRDKVVITSKIPPKTGQWPALDSEPITETFPADWIISCTETSLKRLGTEYLDVQQLHAWADAYNEQLEWHEALTKLQKQGKIRHFGVSANDWNPYNTVRLVESGRVDSVQVIYNIFEQRPAEKLLPAALKHNVGIIVRVPFEEGLLTGKFRPGHTFEPNDWRASWMTPERLQEAQPHIQALEKELDGTYRDLPTLALEFILAHPAVSATIPGMRSVKHVEANCATSQIPPMPADKVQRLKAHKWVHGWKYPWDQELKK